ncbi:hypothetical protein [Alicyclobacillus sp. SO9]|uniref:hypothetical protein n=1 Tax=Alicyclobacillus sp. SO9 TaxID=2665646 RepID=UPI0018E6E4D1|nr:hypothetical protein [Alicyclobacillus sp. SO9]QQE78971.1 hypothetical protein GI364_00100 [Alicyclobacillus sp. SO9]
MRISKMSFDLEAKDINSMIHEFAPEANLWVEAIDQYGVRGHLKLLFWNVDFVAVPYSTDRDEINIQITAHKLVTIPPAIIQRQLQEAIKDAPEGIDVLSQMLRVKITSLLRPFGLSLEVDELQPYDGFVRIGLSGVELQNLASIFAASGARGTTAAARDAGTSESMESSDLR